MQNRVNPKEWTYANIAAMRAQLKTMGLSLDWSREFATCDEDYSTPSNRSCSSTCWRRTSPSAASPR